MDIADKWVQFMDLSHKIDEYSHHKDWLNLEIFFKNYTRNKAVMI